MQIPFLDLKKINAPFTEKFKINFEDFLKSGYYILGDSVKQFEREFAQYCEVKNCIGTGNGLDALTLILKGYIELGKLKKGDQVIVAANTYIATIIAIQNAGLTPLLIDADPKSFNLDPKLLPQKPKQVIKAILVTHLYGQLADMEILTEYCKKFNLLLLSDAAQAHGAINNKGKKAGSIADASGFSFYPTKNLGALGDGGAITTDNHDLTEVIRKLRNYGRSSTYENEYVGVNSRLDEIQAKFLSTKLETLDIYNQKRRAIALRFSEEISNPGIKLPSIKNYDSHVFHQFVIQVSNREKFTNFLALNDIGFLIHYPIPPHKQKCYENEFSDNFPVTNRLSKTILSLPINPILSTEEVNYIISKLNRY